MRMELEPSKDMWSLDTRDFFGWILMDFRYLIYPRYIIYIFIRWLSGEVNKISEVSSCLLIRSNGINRPDMLTIGTLRLLQLHENIQ